MGIFEKIRNAIFAKANAAETTLETSQASVDVAAIQAQADAPKIVDVTAILDQAAAAKGQKLNWKSSVVDLMRALDLDSSLGARRELARELGFVGDTNNSAAMNVWLHKTLVKKLEENGGQIPTPLKE
ncbi:DUF3597 domain-containing protein [Brucella anthropi]|uniref:DUF3597 domain-containing protein n=1 Tax=Brucella anthropi TaxID=529 RepID=UPI000CFCC82D|nr:DUF3597 domain-containing protein [Ochrobactrum sp. MYb49]PQZ61775.1 hypothetical protein CQ057_22595 [Ochrobactrum sp. MYb49]